MFDISNICRICLREEYPKLPIFTEDDEKSGSKPTLPEKIMSFARVKVVKDDGLPMYICVKCYCQVDTTVEFKRLCEESFNYFKKQLEMISKSIPPSHQAEKENFDGQYHTLPEECVKVEECEPECGPAEVAEEEAATQAFREESWVNSDETDFDASLIKCEPSAEFPNIEIDLSNVKIENVSDSWSDEERGNPLEINYGDSLYGKAENFEARRRQANVDRSCKCRSCEIVLANRREMSFHISLVHRRCGTCSKYFYTNKEKKEHVCNGGVSRLRPDKVDGFCHLCNETVEQIESHMADHIKKAIKVADAAGGDAGVGKSGKRNTTGIKIKCSLCDVVCLDERGFKVHLKCMHVGHRVIYPCLKCKSRKFFTKVSCVKHLIERHGIASVENLKFEVERIGSDEEESGRHLEKLKRSRCKPKKVKMGDPMGTAPQQRNWGINKMEPSTRKFVNYLHPPFDHSSPIIHNNFNVTLDHQGVKRYVCRGCDIVYKSYLSAYQHYYTYSRRTTGAEPEDGDFFMGGKPFSCKWCKLKFASGSQAMMHRIHAHKYFYKKYVKEKK